MSPSEAIESDRASQTLAAEAAGIDTEFPSDRNGLGTVPENAATTQKSNLIQSPDIDKATTNDSRLPTIQVLDKQSLQSIVLPEGETGVGLKDRRTNGANGSVKKKRSLILREKPREQEEDDSDDVAKERPISGKKTHLRASDATEKILKLSPDKLYELTSSPDAIPIHVEGEMQLADTRERHAKEDQKILQALEQEQWQTVKKRLHGRKRSGSAADAAIIVDEKLIRTPAAPVNESSQERPPLSLRAVSSPLLKRKHSNSRPPNITPISLKNSKLSAQGGKSVKKDAVPSKVEDAPPSPMPPTIPLPPMSVPTYLQLELSSTKPSPLYIHRSSAADFTYESSRVKIDRLLNFLLLPWHLEGALWFGTLACLDAWLYTFTVLPLRFAKAIWLLLMSALSNLMAEIKYLSRFMYLGVGRVWKRRRTGSVAIDPSLRRGPKETNKQTPVSRSGHRTSDATVASDISKPSTSNDSNRKRANTRHTRTRSSPSNLMPIDKADILKGLLIIVSCVILMYFDASMMYHSIRGQAAIKLYVIYNVLEVFDRLLSAIGQDVLECLFSKEALERKPNGRSKVLRPFWLFLLALIYNVIHATALFYQVITLNVAVNSYSNALLTLLMSNQFVEIKSTVFKKFEKENLFQMTCADIVERFQLWLMLIVIASRNLIETNSLFGSESTSGATAATHTSSSILPSSFTLFPAWTGQVMAPFLLVLGTEMIVDWLKHAYINKFNLVRPNIYGRFLDVLAKDYYSNAFADQNLTRRLGLPVIPLSCLFIRASVQTYQMFLAIHLPHPLPSPSTSLGQPGDPVHSPATTEALLRIDTLFRRALGRHLPLSAPVVPMWGVSWLPSAESVLAWATTLVFWGLVYFVMLTIKLLLGMVLLKYARNRYAQMKAREQESTHAEGKRVGGWGVVEVDEDKRRWVYEDDPEGLRRLREKEREVREREKSGGKGFGNVERYSMVAKRIW